MKKNEAWISVAISTVAIATVIFTAISAKRKVRQLEREVDNLEDAVIDVLFEHALDSWEPEEDEENA